MKCFTCREDSVMGENHKIILINFCNDGNALCGPKTRYITPSSLKPLRKKLQDEKYKDQYKAINKQICVIKEAQGKEYIFFEYAN